MHSTLGEPVVATLPVTGPPPFYGARIERPVTREIVSYWQPAVLTDATADADAFWTVTLESPVDAGDYLLVWVPREDESSPGWREVFTPLVVNGGGGPSGSGSGGFPGEECDDG